MEAKKFYSNRKDPLDLEEAKKWFDKIWKEIKELKIDKVSDGKVKVFLNNLANDYLTKSDTTEVREIVFPVGCIKSLIIEARGETMLAKHLGKLILSGHVTRLLTTLGDRAKLKTNFRAQQPTFETSVRNFITLVNYAYGHDKLDE